MNRENKQEYVNNWASFVRQKERRNALLFQIALRQQIRQYQKDRNLHDITAQPILNSLHNIYKDTGVQWANQVRLTLPVIKGMPMGFSKQILDLINQYFKIDFLNVSELITTTTRNMIADLLIQSNELGEGINWMVREMESKNIPRARLISRTETVAAANQSGLIFANETGMELRKEWISVEDDRTRLHHEEANGQIVPLDGFFIVGGYEMKCPGDKGGKEGKLKVSAKEVCNCRCTTGYSRPK